MASNYPEQLRLYMVEKDISVADLASRIGANDKTVYKWFQRGVVPELRKRQIQNKIGFTFDESETKESNNVELVEKKAGRTTKRRLQDEIDFLKMKVAADQKVISQLEDIVKNMEKEPGSDA